MGRPSTKPQEELYKLYLLRVQSSVQSLQRQYVKLAKAWNAREHEMPENVKQAILERISRITDAFQHEISKAEEPEDDKFRILTDKEKDSLLEKQKKPVEKKTEPVEKKVTPQIPVKK